MAEPRARFFFVWRFRFLAVGQKFIVRIAYHKIHNTLLKLLEHSAKGCSSRLYTSQRRWFNE